ncbi:MAG: hypothetical protein KGZ59_04325 [Chitinophagaceae bacterium]|nr:hypothetical protein [Chitinophagaceae bacterium]
MIKIKNILTLLLATTIVFSSCTKENFSFGDIKAPTGLTLNTVIAGVNSSNPNGDGTGFVAITTTSTGALTYNIDFGDGIKKVVPSGVINYKYATPGTNEFTIIVNAIGTGGEMSTISKKIKVFVAFEIPTTMRQNLTNGTSKVWVTDKDAFGHFGVDNPTRLDPDPGVWWYAATPNTREACAYDDEITFTNAGANITMNVNNKGESFSIGASTSFYGFAGGDGCYPMNTGGTKNLIFMDATSGFTSANSTQIQFKVPGNGIINFGTGGVNYEILSITSANMLLRNIGADGNAWYQKLKVKP